MTKLNLLTNSWIVMFIGANSETYESVEDFNVMNLDPILYDALVDASEGETILSLSLFNYQEYAEQGYIRYIFTSWDGLTCSKYCGQLRYDGSYTRHHVESAQFL